MIAPNPPNAILADIIALIEERNYLPGERLPSERELAERFGVGRGVIREALSVLENLRYLQRKPNSGIYLNPHPERISPEALSLFAGLGLDLAVDKLAQVLEVRRILEIQAVGLACTRRTDEDLAALQDIVDRFDAALLVPHAEIAVFDYEFHMAIFRATHNVVLMQVVNPFYVMSAHRRQRFFSDTERSRVSNQQHRKILECIRAQDTAGAQRLMADHIGRVESLARSEEP
ncbi:MAG: FadR/GntR family transcriptional regulator [Burkholderiaceae bacterium]